MAIKTDIDFFKQDNGLFDIEIDTDGDLKGSNSTNTAVDMSLGTDKRASPSEIKEASLRRGWVGDIFNSVANYEIGSKWWLRDQGRLTNESINFIVGDTKKALNWMLEDNLISNLEVTGTRNIRKNQLEIKIRFVVDANIIERVFILWENSRFN